MSKVTRKELARLVGIKYDQTGTARISAAVRHGNIIEDANKLIDTDLDKNKAWIIDQKIKNGKKEGSDQQIDDDIVLAGVSSSSSIELKLKKQELKKKEAETRLLNLREQKMRGEVIPTDLVKDVFTRFSQSVLNEMRNGLDDLVSLWAKQKDMTNAEIAEIRMGVTGVLNSCISNAIEDSEKSIEQIADPIDEEENNQDD